MAHPTWIYPASRTALVYEDRDGLEIVHVFGEIDLSSSPELETMLECCSIRKRVVVDLSECSYADSSVLAVLVRAHKRFGEKLNVVACESGKVRRLFRITGIESLLSIAPTLDAVVA